MSRLKELVEVVAHAKKKKQRNTTADLDVPVYARTYPLERPLGPLPDWMRDAVMSPEEFADGYLRGGRVFHGTQRVDWALSILRGGFRETTYAQGVARGTYMSPDRNLSSQYANAKQGGFLLELELREGIRPNVFTLSRCAERVEKELGPEAEAAGIEIADLLAAKYGFDVIVLSDSEMLMKNPSILEPMKLHTIVRSVGEGLRGDGPLDPDAAQRFIGYHGLHPFAHALGHGDLPPLPQTSAIVRRLIEGFDPKRFFETLMAFYAVQQSGLMDDEVRREVNAFVATRTHWTDLEMGQFAGQELTQFLDDETLLSLLRSPPPITDPAKFVFFVSNLPEKAQKLLTSEVRSLLTPELVLDVIGRASHSEFALSTLLSSSAATPELCHALAQRCDDGIALAVAQGDVEEAFILLNHLFTAYEFAEVEVSPQTQKRLDALLGPFIEEGKVDFFVDPARMGKHNGYGVSLLSDSLADVLLSTLFERALQNNLAGYPNIFFWRALQIPAWSPRLLEGVEALVEQSIIPAGFLPRFQKRLLV